MRSLYRWVSVLTLLFMAQSAVQAASAQAQPQADMRHDLRAKFEADIKKINDEFPGAFGAVFIDLTDNDRIALNADRVMPTASTIKVSILIELFRQAEQKPGLLMQQRPFKANEATGRSGMARLISANSMLTLEDIAKIMINLSENTATNILIDEVGMENVNKTIAAMGLKTMKLRRKMLDSASGAAGEENVSSPADGATIMYKIAKCDLPVSKASCDRIRQIMEIPQPEHPAKDPIPRNIPVAFKWGGLEGVSNGWGIVSLPDRPYIFIIMTTYGEDTAPTVRKASETALNYYSILARTNAYGVRNPIGVVESARAKAK